MVAVTAAAVLAGGGTALALGHGRRPGPVFLPRIMRLGPVSQGPVGIAQVPPACAEYTNTTSSAVPSGFRVEFGEVAVQPSFVPVPPTPNPGGPRDWRYLEKTGFEFLGSAPSVISVPAGWQKVVALGTPTGMGSALHLPACYQFGGWNTFITVFYLHSPVSCVPLRIQVGSRAATVWFGFGRRCHGG
jgi:hypothetical protein